MTHTVHPTQKPVELCGYLIKTYTSSGEVVADICAGSGTTAIAALNTSREFICFERLWPFSARPRGASRRRGRRCPLAERGVTIGKYSVIYADPPWRYAQKGIQGAAERHYPTMGIEELCALPVADLAALDSVLFL